MRVIMTGGGTGGHIYPAIAIADRIRQRDPEAEVLFVGTERGLEKTLVPKNGYEIKFIRVRGFDRKHLLKNAQVLKELAEGTRMARIILAGFKPDIVIGTGGYVCGPVVKEAAKMGIRTFIHEQNAFPGMTNKLLERYVENVFISFEEASRYFRQKEKLVLTGNPVRQAFFTAEKQAARKELGIDADTFMVLSFGGSQGAGKLNDAMTEAVQVFSGIEGMSLYMGTGSRYYAGIAEKLEGKVGGNIHILEYIDNMELYLAACDVVISRSGALTVSEITVLGKPSILIPSPNVTGNHQYFNAKAVSDKGGAILIEEKDFSAEPLIAQVLRLKNNPTLLAGMEAGSRLAAPGDACGLICDSIGIR